MEAAAETKQEQESGFKVVVSFNGLNEEIQVHPHDTVKQVLDRALAAYGNPPNPHTLSLYNAGGTELLDGQTVKDAGVHAHDVLLLRTSAVKGG
jgi:hypothetical protein